MALMTSPCRCCYRYGIHACLLSAMFQLAPLEAVMATTRSNWTVLRSALNSGHRGAAQACLRHLVSLLRAQLGAAGWTPEERRDGVPDMAGGTPR
jgi:hypothetical protein